MNEVEINEIEKKYNIVMRPPSTTPPPLMSLDEHLTKEQ